LLTEQAAMAVLNKASARALPIHLRWVTGA
jgi:hypothetical protein